MNHYLEVAIDAAREAGALLATDFGRPKNISYKGEVDLVTESDRRAEALIVDRLRSHFPSHAIVAEEGSAAPGERFCWHIDPLDGTTNFAHGYPCFAVSIGLLEAGDPLVGAVFNPISGELFTAARGEGAWLEHKSIRVSTTEKLAASLVATGFPTDRRRQSINISYYWEYTLRSHGVRRDGAASLDLCALACGRFDGFWEFGLKSWDTAAGMLIVTEAGGMVTDFAGRPYHPGDPEVLVTNGRIHSEMQQVAADVAARLPQSQP
ncbi:MAG TPA: inositol monophosphatase family protein [Candidatus Limnocylindrales bacterium]|nr:inositol monophosphatase family protein [Candidatus Limnocylindrales bacterium]